MTPQNTIPLGSNDATGGAGCIGAHDDESEPPPVDFVELIEFRSIPMDRKLGYFGVEPIVIFGYCPGGGEVIWRDGHASGFAAGAWRVFLEEIAPPAAQAGANLGGHDRAGTHVLLMDRRRSVLYTAPRESVETFLARTYGIPRPSRQCLCALKDCALCSIPDSPRSKAK